MRGIFAISARARSHPTARSVVTWAAAIAPQGTGRQSRTRESAGRDMAKSTIFRDRLLAPAAFRNVRSRVMFRALSWILAAAAALAGWRRRARASPLPRPQRSPRRRRQDPGFTTSTTAVVVDVVVRDAKGAPIVDLGAVRLRAARGRRQAAHRLGRIDRARTAAAGESGHGRRALGGYPVEFATRP